MNNIYHLAYDETAWQKYYDHCVENGHRNKRELSYLSRYIENKKYLEILDNLRAGQPFALARVIRINKKGVSRKRVVFSFPDAETELLRFWGYQLHAFDNIFSRNLYSFIQGRSAKDAIKYFAASRGLQNCYALKLDIHDYFNSVDIAILLPELKTVLSEQPELYDLIAEILQNDFVEDDGEIIAVKKGIMAGSPLSPFLADLYLSAMDHYFYDQKIKYARYADDIIVFAKDRETLDACHKWIGQFLLARNLKLNPRKIKLTLPGENWEFLGFSYQKGVIDISLSSLEKVKAKLRRKARAIYRWRSKKGASADQAVRVFIRYFNKKFYDNQDEHELTWARWYFPVINSTERLHQIDLYMQQCIRYVATGTHNKRAYDYRYEQIKANGYRPLVHEYYKCEFTLQSATLDLTPNPSPKGRGE